MSNDLHIHRFENKPQPAQIPSTKIVEAYGLRKCPKLVYQIAGSDLTVRQNALAVICEELHNPYSVSGTADEGAIKVLAKMVNDPDYITRERSTRALSIAATDAKGLQTIVDDQAIPFILNGVNDPSEVVRGNVYNCLYSVTTSASGIEACVQNGATAAFVSVLIDEIDSLKPVVLKALHNIVGSENGLVEAINTKAVDKCIELLTKSVDNCEAGNKDDYDEYEPSIIACAAKTLGFMCFDGRAKLQALEGGAVKQLMGLLKSKVNLSGDVKASISISVMAISITDLGKIQIYECPDAVEKIISLLYDNNKIVVLNTLKIISNVAIHPKSRAILVGDSTCCAKLKRLMKSDDQHISRHALIALDAVNWKP